MKVTVTLDVSPTRNDTGHPFFSVTEIVIVFSSTRIAVIVCF